MAHDCHHHSASTIRGNLLGFGLILSFALPESFLEIIIGYWLYNNIPNLGSGFHTISDMFLEISVFSTFLVARFYPQLTKNVAIEKIFITLGIALFIIGASIIFSVTWTNTTGQGKALQATLIGYGSIGFNIAKHWALSRYVHKDGVFDAFSAHIKGDAALGFVVGTSGAVRWIYGEDGIIDFYLFNFSTTQIDFMLSNAIGIYLLYLAFTLAQKYKHNAMHHH